jgi:hypothetical protein
LDALDARIILADRLELLDHDIELSRKGIVFVGLAFDVAPLSSVFVGRANKGFGSMAHGQVIDPP